MNVTVIFVFEWQLNNLHRRTFYDIHQITILASKENYQNGSAKNFHNKSEMNVCSRHLFVTPPNEFHANQLISNYTKELNELRT